MDSDYGIPRELSDLQQLRSLYHPELPPCLQVPLFYYEILVVLKICSLFYTRIRFVFFWLISDRVFSYYGEYVFVLVFFMQWLAYYVFDKKPVIWLCVRSTYVRKEFMELVD